MEIEHKLLDLAVNQLETAVALFISGHDKFSVVTLAGAADAILSQYVTRQNRKNFSRLIAEKDNRLDDYKQVGSEINDVLHINALKHLDPGDEEYVDIDDLDACSIAAILKALVNYKILNPVRGMQFIEAFRQYLSSNVAFSHYVGCVII